MGFTVCTHVFSRTVAAVDTKRGYVGMCNGRSAQQESGARRCPRTACLKRKKLYSYYTRCALIRDRQPTAWDGFARPAQTEATCVWKVSPQIVVQRFLKSLYYECQVRGSFCERSEDGCKDYSVVAIDGKRV